MLLDFHVISFKEEFSSRSYPFLLSLPYPVPCPMNFFMVCNITFYIQFPFKNLNTQKFCRKGDPFQGPKLGSCLTLGNECLRRHVCWKSKRLYWERAPGWRAGGEGNPGKQLCHMACSVWFYGNGVSFWIVFSQSFWLRVLAMAVHSLFSQDGCQREGFWEVVRHVVSPFDLSWALPVGGGLLVPCSLPGPPVIKQLMQMATMVPGQGGQFQSVCFP